MLYRYFLMAMLLLPLCMPSLMTRSFAEDLPLQELYKMSPNIQAILQVCPWRSATTKGTIRLMQVEVQGAHKLYVQWLREGIAGTSQEPLSTMGIKEVNDEGYYRFNLPRGRLLAGACSIETIMEDIIDERRFRLTVYLTGPGKYETHITRLLDGGLKPPVGE
ncbi:hypothetical protein A9R00_06270 [Oleispira antarctica]|uniref:Uncharacterized protein n=1 Tax=Oleispira antarctica TaxID=188908 RepID=A0A1Y5HZA7_OLEAN|nr:hypothetical protein A9R00_06270 [Oleispira antarctica]